MTARSPAAKARRNAKRIVKRQAYFDAVARLRTAGKSCERCAHRRKTICELGSDSNSQQVVTLDYVCPEFEERKP
jgi:hypothetical protein